ncbi:carboxylesterase family protein [Novosphingobium flavum]|uniref:Carboxylic ester hydrolase n=1 Tax=Novosphingobium flavum TaxID=1778672 RepID=A0A7X1FSE9_9SPHN|nr:carboxylesterase family protein [Novosphingobium flavum]MBC2666098.1 carboxylesterase family protein [Novosphingobium flavum]
MSKYRDHLLLFAGVAALQSLPLGAQERAGPVVAVTGGQVRGDFMPGPGGAAFKGIPYAAPPMGDLRWRETRPLKPWRGVLAAGVYRPGCGQMDPATKQAGEDCLFLNVWSPEWPARTKKPVIFWINGGELFGGSGALKPGSESLARQGVVLVSANYRGTLLGMMGHAELAAESPHRSSANYMLHDQVAVLNWIHRNIARFGGDPDNVTIFGQSGGGHSVSMLLASPLTKGLVHRAIIDSGAPMQVPRPYVTRQELEQIGTVTAEVLHAPKTDTIRYLRALPAAQVVAAMPEVRARLLAMGGEAYDEGTDGYVIPVPPGEVWAAHNEHHVPLIIGSTSQDTAGTIRGVAVPGPGASIEAVAAWKKEALELFYGKDADLLEAATRIYGLRGKPDEQTDYAPYGTQVQQLGTDLNHRCGTIYSAALHSKVAPTWLFEFSRTTPGKLPVHSSELPYLFGHDDLPDAAARAYSGMMQRYWVNFARSGNPNGPGLPQWPGYEPTSRASIEFANEGPVVRKGMRVAACAPYEAKLARDPRPLTGGLGTWIRGPAITVNTEAATPRRPE